MSRIKGMIYNFKMWLILKLLGDDMLVANARITGGRIEINAGRGLIVKSHFIGNLEE